MPILSEPIALVPKKPQLTSHDSGVECSLDHWLEVYCMVEEEYVLFQLTDAEALNTTVSPAA